MTKTLRIGTNRSNPRIWIEGSALSANGWKKGDHFIAYFRNGSIVYERVITGTPGARKVAGTEARPIIDTNCAKITESLGADTTHATVTITPDKITITPGKAPLAALAAKVAATALLAAAFAAPYISQFAPNAKRVLVACEESATVRDEFTRLGHDAVSCDLMPTRNPYGWHIQGDVMPWLEKEWDLILGFPPCTFLTNSAAWAFNDPDYDRYPGVGYHQRIQPGTLTGEARRKARLEAVALVKSLYAAATQVCIENPTGHLNTAWMKPTQIIEPWHHGDPESKATCLWLKGLPALQPTAILDIKQHGYLAANGTWRWQNQTPNGQNNIPPSADRAKLRSKTYPGIARAMARQFGAA
jgi:hypothetical protein